MKICRVTQALYPYVIGGSPIHCHELSNCQSTDGHQVTVLTVKRGAKVEEIACHYYLKQFRWFKMPWDFLGMENPICPGMWWELFKSDFDLIHTHSHLFFTTLVSVIISKIKNKPCVVTVHGVRAVRDKATNLFQEVWLKLFSRLIFKITEKIICLTQADADEIKNYGVQEEKVVVIPNGIDTQLFNQYNFHNDYILWVGRFVEEKGLKYLVEALEGVANVFPNKRVVLVGDGPLKQEIMIKVNKKGLNNMFEYKENCSQQEIAKLMKSCELFVLPSLKEGFPKCLLEAMACGKPVITTKGLKEIVNGAGVTVNSKNPEELRNAITDILFNPLDAKKMGLIGRTKVEQNWSWSIVSNRLEEIYQQVVGDK